MISPDEKASWESERLLLEQKSILQISSKATGFRRLFDVGFILLMIVGVIGGLQVAHYVKSIERVSQYSLVTENLVKMQMDLEQAELFVMSYQKNHNQDSVDRYNLALRKVEQRMSLILRAAGGLGITTELIEPLRTALNKDVDMLTAGMRKANFQPNSKIEAEVVQTQEDIAKKIQTEKSEIERGSQVIFGIVICCSFVAFVMLYLWKRWSLAEKGKLESLSYLLSEKQKDLILAQSKAVEADEAKLQFLNNMSHEIRTPLNAVMGLSELLSRGVLTAQQSMMISGVKSAAKSLLELVNEVLDFAKIQNQGLERHDSFFYVQDLLQELCEILRGTAELKQLKVISSIDTTLPKIFSDQLRLRQVLMNLAINSIKFTDTGQVSLSVHKQKDQWRFEVQDTGIGIPLESQDKIFQSFYQINSANDRKSGGTGLGLSICKAIVENMQGQIGFTSERDKGTTFWFEIPAPCEAPTANLWQPVKAAPEKIRTYGGKMRALIVEDNLLNQMVLTGYLKELGVTSQTCIDGFRALEVAATDTFDVIFVDCQMPQMDGFTLTKKLRALENTRNIKFYIVASTAHTTPGYREKCLQNGMDEYLSKPIHFEQLQAIVDLAFSKNGKTLADFVQTEPPVKKPLMLNKARWDKWKKMPSQKGNFLQEMLGLFVQSFEDKIQEMKSGVSKRNWEQVENAAHYLKSSCSDIGAEHLSSLCAEIEGMSADPDRAQGTLAALVQELDLSYKQIHPELRSAA